MKVKFDYGTKRFVVFTAHTVQILFSHKSKSECYEWIFKQMHYA